MSLDIEIDKLLPWWNTFSEDRGQMKCYHVCFEEITLLNVTRIFHCKT